MPISTMDRREILQTAGILGASTVAGCLGGDGGDGDGGESGQQTSTTTSDENFRGKTLNMLIWAGYEGLKEMFERETGASANYKLISSDINAFNTLKGGGTKQYDLVLFNNDWGHRNAKAGNTVPIKLDEYPSHDDWLERFQPPIDPFMHEGKMYGIPIRWGWGGLGYNADKVDLDVLKEKGYAACWDPEYEGKVVAVDWPTWVIPLVMAQLGYEPFAEHEQSVLDELEKTLVELFKNVSALHTGAAALRQDLIYENALLSIGVGNYALSQLTFEGYTNIKIMLPPDEGGWFWFGGPALVNNPDLKRSLANKWINLGLSPEGQYRICHKDAKSKGCPVNKAAFEKFSEEEQRKILMFQDKTFDALPQILDQCFTNQISPQQDKWLDIWSRAKSNIGQ